MWCDDFDMDLPKIIPDAHELLGDIADVEMWTTGHLTDGKLNHPDVWNGTKSMLAFFGFRKAPCSESTFYSTCSPAVRCTAWEAFRDAWPHGYRLVVEGLPTWDTFAIQKEFMAILQFRRWQHGTQANHDRAMTKARQSLERGIERLRDVVALHDGLVAREAS